MRLYESVDELIGRTPLVRLRRLSEGSGWAVYGKLESNNPGGSVKDRLGLAMVLDAEARGILTPGGTIVEPTSGNTGIGLAMVAVHRGYRVLLTMPETASLERRMLFTAFGAELVLTPGRLGMVGAIQKAEELVQEIPDAVTLRQFDNPANVEIHRKTTGPEIWQDTDGSVTALIAGVGTGGTITGIGEYLKSHNPRISVVAVEPKESSVLMGENPGPHKIQGLGAGFVPKILNRQVIDDIVPVAGDEAMAQARIVALEEGILTGISGGAALAGAREWLARHASSTGLAVVILPDSGERYLSTSLYQGQAHHV
ncbi:MAG: cysteine synthase A [Firmicutes bacterium]|nr:cysteine synthase A [Bacillota bacterium]